MPLYHHLKRELLKAIESGVWEPGMAIPSEAELAEQYHVSRTTVRQATSDLVSLGYLVRRQGRGTFVQDRQRSGVGGRLYGFAEELRQRGFRVDVRVEAVESGVWNGDVQDELNTEEQHILRMIRVARVEGRPVFREISYLVPPFGYTAEELLHQPELYEFVYGFFEQNGVKISVGRQTVHAEKATESDVEYLGVGLEDAVLVVRRVTKDSTGTAVEFSEVRYVGDFYRMEIELYRGEASDRT